VSARSLWGVSPRESIEAECERRGRRAVIDGCIELLAGGDADLDLVVALGGPTAAQAVDGGARGDQRYWLRVWAARGLLWVWDETASDSVVDALSDEVWRVREMACKVVARHELGAALPAVVELRDDPVERVRQAAARALRVLTTARA